MLNLQVYWENQETDVRARYFSHDKYRIVGFRKKGESVRRMMKMKMKKRPVNRVWYISFYILHT
jgi:hypothetical protein